MQQRKISTALISVTDKTGIASFASDLCFMYGVKIVSTGGTATALRDAGVAVTDVSEVTGFPEILNGRVKTLHSNIAAGILAVRSDTGHMSTLSKHQISCIDMVVVNLYDFESAASKHGLALEKLVEQIDIGGPTMIRSAAKNWQDVIVVTSPSDYAAILRFFQLTKDVPLSYRWELAKAAIQRTAEYDTAISNRLRLISVQDNGVAVDAFQLQEK